MFRILVKFSNPGSIIFSNDVTVNNHLKIFRLLSASSTTSEVNKKENHDAKLRHLITLEKKFQEVVPQFFYKSHPLSLYAQDLIFKNNIKGTQSKGIAKYSLQLSLIKLYHVVNYSSNRVELLNLVKNPEESSLKIRWRIISRPGMMKWLISFSKSYKTEIWKDGISTMIINDDGKVCCHICDNIDIDIIEEKKSKQSIKERLVDGGLNV